MFDGWTKPKFYTKCKSALRRTRTRLEPITKKRVAVEKFLKKDIADLLKDGLDYNAYLRADMLLVEQNMTSCYDIIKQFSEYISKHLSDMQSQRKCPLECRESAASLAYAAARFADLPDLRQLRSVFTERYGSSFESFANKEFVEKLKADPPTKDMRLLLLHNIAHEFSVDWDSKALEQKLFTPSPQDDLPKHYSLDQSKLCGNGENEVTAEPRRDRTSSRSIGDVLEDDAENERPSYRFINPPYTKPKSRSIQRRPLSEDNEQTGDGIDQWDEEERELDGLLLHYSTKKSMPVSEVEHSAGNVKMVQARSSWVELGGHVHPRMPDYDELAARIAALRGT